MGRNIAEKRPLPLLKSAIHSLGTHRLILYPFVIIALLQLFVLEILYFSPRYPLNLFFGPIIRKLWSDQYLHYPLNFLLLPKLFQYAQFVIYIFISSFLFAVAIAIIAKINNGEKCHMKTVVRETRSFYIHIVVVAMISWGLVFTFIKSYGWLYAKVLLMPVQSGIQQQLKQVIIEGAPYFNLLLSVLITTLLAYTLPIIVIEKRKAFTAIALNFRFLWGSFWTTFCIVLFPSLFFVPILVLRASVPVDFAIPEMRLWILVLSTGFMFVIDAVIYTSLTTLYLMKKEV